MLFRSRQTRGGIGAGLSKQRLLFGLGFGLQQQRLLFGPGIEHQGLGAAAGGVELGFALAFGMSAALVTRASRCSMLVEDTDAPGSKLQARVGFVGVWVIFLLLGALAWIGPLLASAAPRVKSFLALLSIVPLALVIAVIFWFATREDPHVTDRRKEGRKHESLADMLEPLKNIQVWR